jgi:hypothetical protein
LRYDEDDLVTDIVVITLSTLSHALLSAAFSLVLGFWVDALHAKMRVKLARRTKILCFVVAAIMILAIPGSLLSVLGFGQIGTMLIIIPYVVNMLFFLVTVIVLECGCCTKKSSKMISESTKKKVSYANRWMPVAATGWIGAVVLESAYGLLKPMQGMNTAAALLHIVALLFEFVMIIGTVMLLEHRTRVGHVFYDVFHCKRRTAVSSNSTRTATTGAGNQSMQTMQSTANADGASRTTTTQPATSSSSVVASSANKDSADKSNSGSKSESKSSSISSNQNTSNSNKSDKSDKSDKSVSDNADKSDSGSNISKSDASE